MLDATIYDSYDALRHAAPNDVLDDVSSRPYDTAVLMAEPTAFDVVYELDDNVFMDETYEVDSAEAWAQWHAVKDAYQELGIDVHVMEGVEDLPDMVFTANHGMPYEKNGRKGLVLSNMKHPERADEVESVEQWCRDNGYDTFELVEAYTFEGTGDAIWHPGKNLLWGGHGVRSDRDVYDALLRSNVVDAPIITLELDPGREWYHLDTCFAPLSKDTAMAYRDAFTDEDWAKINHVFDTVIPVPGDEARNGLAANAHSTDGKTVIMNDGNPRTTARLEAAGFTVKPVDTGEFGESGGSVYCMKLAVPE